MATGDPSPTYQWEKSEDGGTNWEAVPKATKSELAFSKVTTLNAGLYRVKAINGGGTVTSNEATLVVYFAPRISTQPKALSVNEGDPVTLSVESQVWMQRVPRPHSRGIRTRRKKMATELGVLNRRSLNYRRS